MTRAEKVADKLWRSWVSESKKSSLPKWTSQQDGIEFDVASKAWDIYVERTSKPTLVGDSWGFKNAIEEAAQEIVKTRLDKVLE